jgi:hypothetical protein
MEQFKNPARTMEEEMSRERKFWKRNQICTAIVVVVVLFGLLGGNSHSVAPGANLVTLTMHDDRAVTVSYREITEAELLEDVQYGTVLEGKETRQGRSGTWENSQWGSYTLCVYASWPDAIRMETQEGIFVVNLASEEETQQLYQLIQQKMPAAR